MANVTAGYTFTGTTDPITFTKLNLLGTPTVTIGTAEVTLAKMAALTGTGYLVGSTPAAATFAEFRINDTGLTLHTSSVGLSFGMAAADCNIGIGQSATAKALIGWVYNATESATAFNILTYHGGAVAGTMSISTSQWQVKVNANAIALTANNDGFGYVTTQGGAITQTTNKSTAVTLSKVCGQITMDAASLAADTTVSFTLTNTKLAAGDVLILNHISGGTAGSYLLNAQSAIGSASINVRNITTGALAEAIVIAFAVIKAVAA